MPKHRGPRLVLAAVAAVAIAAACMPGSQTVSPTAGNVPGPSATPGASPTGSASPGGTAAGLPSVTDLGLRGSAYPLGEQVRMAPAPDGFLYVAIPQATGARLVLLDGSGRPRAGWPVVVPDSTYCGLLLTAEDGSVRAVCDATDLPHPELEAPPGRAFAFDAQGRALAGWPVQVPPGFDGRLVDDELRLVETRYLTDVFVEGEVTHEVSVLAIATDGALRRGRPVRMVETCCGHQWTVGPDGVAYGVYYDPPLTRQPPRPTDLFAVNLGGAVSGWPQRVDGVASAPSFDRSGTILVVVGSHGEAESRVVAFRPAGGGAFAVSPSLPLRTTAWGSEGGTIPAPPLLAADGTTFVYSDLVEPPTTVFALHSLTDAGGDRAPDGGQVMAGWPYRAPGDLGPAGYCEPEAICLEQDPAAALTRERSLILPLAAASEGGGGRLMAVGLDAQEVAGWPVELRRPGAAFWAVVAGPDGTAFALAVEPEAGGAASASILAFAPDSTVRSVTTILEP